MSRSRDGPQKFLHSFRGYLHADAYAGYDAIYLGSDNEVVEVACWAHARRKFFDACKNYPREAHRHSEADPVLRKTDAVVVEHSITTADASQNAPSPCRHRPLTKAV